MWGLFSVVRYEVNIFDNVVTDLLQSKNMLQLVLEVR
jgi:hypothetical protein